MPVKPFVRLLLALAGGMAAFGEQIDREESAATRAYLIQQAWRGKTLAEAKP